MKYLLFSLLLFIPVLYSCSDQSKAEEKVSSFIKKFSLNPETYEPIEFEDLKTTDKGYELGHMYRIVTRKGIKEIKTHTFKLSKEMNVYVAPFESFD